MLKLNKESKIAKVEVTAQGSYSSAIAYGEVYLPYELYEAAKDIVDNYTTYADELDGKHSASESDTPVIKEMTLEELVHEKEFNDYTVYLTEIIEDELGMAIDEYLEGSELEVDIVNLRKLSKKVSELKREYTDGAKGRLAEEIKVSNVEVGGVLQDVVIPAGTIVDLTVKANIDYNIEIPIDK